jgi:hypothetical protein
MPAIIAVDALAHWCLPRRLLVLPLLPIVYIGWALVDRLVPALLMWNQLEPSELRRLLYERWSALSRPALYASVVLFCVLAVRALWRRHVRVRVRE